MRAGREREWRANAQSRYFILKADDSQSVCTCINDLEDKSGGKGWNKRKAKNISSLYIQPDCLLFCFLTGFHLRKKKKKGIHSSDYGSTDTK